MGRGQLRPVGPTHIQMRICEHEGKDMPMVKKSFLGLGAHGFHRIVYFEWGDPRNEPGQFNS